MNRQIILKQTDEFQYVLTKITREECEEIQALMRLNAEESDKYPNIHRIEGCAHISKVTESQLSPYIPIHNIWKERNENYPSIIHYTNEFQCYANANRNPKLFSSNVIIHEDRIGALKCACNCIGAEYFYIEKKTNWIKKEEENFKKQIEEEGRSIVQRMAPYVNYLNESHYKLQIELNKNKNNGTNNNNNSSIHPENTGE